MKYSMYQYRNFIVAFSALGFIGIMAGCLDMSISLESTNPKTVSTVSEQTPSVLTNTGIDGNEINSDNTPTNSVESNSQKNQSTVVAYRFDSDKKTKASGLLRMSNKTTQPVRLALLARQLSQKSATANKATSNIPAHWDFAPEEGSEKGLVLSLPQGNLRLDKGDVLVAFAQDGSRRYWGPYIIGETSSPQWNPQTQEWQLVLQNR